jgi:aryl-alcohol dehydrogenase-like predicted oxidoreductase
MPMLGLGVWQVPNGPECVNAVRWALDLGYRHIDTAQAYGNEESAGNALRNSGMPRDQVFMTTKFYPGRKDPVAKPSKAFGGSASTRSTCTSSTGPKAVHSGRGRVWSALASWDSPVPSASPTPALAN